MSLRGPQESTEQNNCLGRSNSDQAKPNYRAPSRPRARNLHINLQRRTHSTADDDVNLSQNPPVDQQKSLPAKCTRLFRGRLRSSENQEDNNKKSTNANNPAVLPFPLPTSSSLRPMDLSGGSSSRQMAMQGSFENNKKHPQPIIRPIRRRITVSCDAELSRGPHQELKGRPSRKHTETSNSKRETRRKSDENRSRPRSSMITPSRRRSPSVSPSRRRVFRKSSMESNGTKSSRDLTNARDKHETANHTRLQSQGSSQKNEKKPFHRSRRRTLDSPPPCRTFRKATVHPATEIQEEDSFIRDRSRPRSSMITPSRRRSPSLSPRRQRTCEKDSAENNGARTPGQSPLTRAGNRIVKKEHQLHSPNHYRKIEKNSFYRTRRRSMESPPPLLPHHRIHRAVSPSPTLRSRDISMIDEEIKNFKFVTPEIDENTTNRQDTAQASVPSCETMDLCDVISFNKMATHDNPDSYDQKTQPIDESIARHATVVPNDKDSANLQVVSEEDMCHSKSEEKSPSVRTGLQQKRQFSSQSVNSTSGMQIDSSCKRDRSRPRSSMITPSRKRSPSLSPRRHRTYRKDSVEDNTPRKSSQSPPGGAVNSFRKKQLELHSPDEYRKIETNSFYRTRRRSVDSPPPPFPQHMIQRAVSPTSTVSSSDKSAISAEVDRNPKKTHRMLTPTKNRTSIDQHRHMAETSVPRSWAISAPRRKFTPRRQRCENE